MDIVSRITILFATLLAFSITGVAGNFTVEKVAPDVYAVIRTEPASLWFNPNTVFIVGKKFVTVVDTNIAASYTREVIAELRKITSKPVRYVVNTHWHDDHITGNRAYRDAFPGVEFIAHESTLTDLPNIGAANRKGSVENGPGLVALFKRCLKDGKNIAGLPITNEERRGYESDIELVESFLAESPNFEIILPTRTVRNRLEINDGKRTIEVLFLGRAHTGADIVVNLPKEKIVACGDLIVSPVPLIGSTSFPLEYADTLERLLALNAKTIVPGHGPVMRDGGFAREMIKMLRSIKTQAVASKARGENLDEMRKSFDLNEFEKFFAGNSQHLRFVFENYVFLSATAAAFGELSKKAGK